MLDEVNGVKNFKEIKNLKCLQVRTEAKEQTSTLRKKSQVKLF